jgi:hypothetical protein
MKIYIDRISDKIDSRTVYRAWPSGGYILTSLEWVKLMDKLKSKFESVKFYERACDFYFLKDADEAYFILWSSEGIEL